VKGIRKRRAKAKQSKYRKKAIKITAEINK
jgi:hypothetical protein